MFTVVYNDKVIQPRYKVYYIYLLSAQKSTWNVPPIYIFPPLFFIAVGSMKQKTEIREKFQCMTEMTPRSYPYRSLTFGSYPSLM